MRWLLDQGLPVSAAVLLREAAVDALHVSEISMSRARDSEILEFAGREKRIVVTLDTDFHTLLAISGCHGPSVIRIREEGLKGPELSRLILRLRDRFATGCAISATLAQARLRLLPILI